MGNLYDMQNCEICIFGDQCNNMMYNICFDIQLFTQVLHRTHHQHINFSVVTFLIYSMYITGFVGGASNLPQTMDGLGTICSE